MKVDNSNSVDTGALLRMIEQQQQAELAGQEEAPLRADRVATMPVLEPPIPLDESSFASGLGRYVNILA